MYRYMYTYTTFLCLVDRCTARETHEGRLLTG